MPVVALSGAAEVSVGKRHACARLNNGTVKCWGDNSNGNLGAGLTPDFTTAPNKPVTGLSGAVELRSTNDDWFSGNAFYTRACARLDNGSVGCWGLNFTDQGVSGATQIAVGAGHNCAVRNDATAICWGVNLKGQVGDGTNSGPGTPVNPVQGLTGVVEVAAGRQHSCARLNDGSAICWGDNARGQLGDSTILERHYPLLPVKNITGVLQVVAGGDHSCALLGDHTVVCWGSNDWGELGDGTTNDSKVPVPVMGLSGVTQISAADNNACALLTDGTVKCWGNNGVGQLGDGTTMDRYAPVTVIGLP